MIWGLNANDLAKILNLLNNIEFDIKSQTLNIFQLHKKWNMNIIFKNLIIVINLHGF
jgi:hypothetical protein